MLIKLLFDQFCWPNSNLQNLTQLLDPKGSLEVVWVCRRGFIERIHHPDAKNHRDPLPVHRDNQINPECYFWLLTVQPQGRYSNDPLRPQWKRLKFKSSHYIKPARCKVMQYSLMYCSSVGCIALHCTVMNGINLASYCNAKRSFRSINSCLLNYIHRLLHNIVTNVMWICLARRGIRRRRIHHAFLASHFVV